MENERWEVRPRATDYAVSSEGRVKRITASKGTRVGKVLRPALSGSGYPVVNIGGKMEKIHVLMLEAFKRAPVSGEQGRHLDDVKTNNVLSNLEWGTRSQNYADRVANGGGNHGSRHGNARLTEAQVIEIRRSHPEKSFDDLAGKFGVTHGAVWQIVKRIRWRHI